MPRDGAVTLSDMQARGLDRLRVSCRLCSRVGSYRMDAGLERWGDVKLTDLLAELRADCPRGKGPDPYQRCGAFYPDL
jgi:hypothetical protein